MFIRGLLRVKRRQVICLGLCGICTMILFVITNEGSQSDPLPADQNTGRKSQNSLLHQSLIRRDGKNSHIERRPQAHMSDSYIDQKEPTNAFDPYMYEQKEESENKVIVPVLHTVEKQLSSYDDETKKILIADDTNYADDYSVEDGILNNNPPFKPGDFDLKTDLISSNTIPNTNTLKSMHNRHLDAINRSKSGTKTTIHKTNVKRLKVNVPFKFIKFPNVTVTTKDQVPAIEDKIFWSQEVEKSLPRGITSSEMPKLLSRLRRQKVKKMLPPQWNKCGRPKNQFVQLSDGTPMCARYRHPHDKLVQGEVLSFYLASLLGLENIPAVVLSQVNVTNPSKQWYKLDITHAMWEEGKIVALIQWINGLETPESRVKMPPIMLDAYENNEVLDYHSSALKTLTLAELVNLAQWSDMILFDYITGNYDRVASMQDGALNEGRPSVMHETIRNLRRSIKTGSLWLFDNESGLFDAYELLYNRSPASTAKRFINFHKKMLKTMCIFRKSTVTNIRRLADQKNPREVLVNYAQQHEPLLRKLPNILYHSQFNAHFHERLKEILSYVEGCQHR